MTFKFGERVLVKAQIKRQKGQPDKDGNIIPNKDYRYWLRIEHSSPQPAIFLGKRTLSNGKNDGILTEDGWEPYFDPSEYIPGAWICRPGRNPEKVFLSDIETINIDLEEHHSELALEIAGLVFKRLQELK